MLSKRQAWAGVARKGFRAAQNEYGQGWHEYTRALPQVESKTVGNSKWRRRFWKALDDKTHRGAPPRSPSIPWGAGQT